MPLGFREHVREMVGIRSEENDDPAKVYLSYHDVTITRADMDALANDWLTDNNIGFWEDYLEHEELARFKGNTIVLLKPTMVMLLKYTEDLSTIRSDLPDLTNASHIFLPINDSTDLMRAEGGTHWSLLVVGIADRVAFHYDSLLPSNEPEARSVTRQLEKLICKPLRLSTLRDTPQQDNGSDCGVHVCWAMKYLLMRRLLLVDPTREVDMSLGGKRCEAAVVRKEMWGIIRAQRRKATRSASPSSKKKGRSGEPSPPRIGDEPKSA